MALALWKKMQYAGTSKTDFYGRATLPLKKALLSQYAERLYELPLPRKMRRNAFVCKFLGNIFEPLTLRLAAAQLDDGVL